MSLTPRSTRAPEHGSAAAPEYDYIHGSGEFGKITLEIAPGAGQNEAVMNGQAMISGGLLGAFFCCWAVSIPGCPMSLPVLRQNGTSTVCNERFVGGNLIFRQCQTNRLSAIRRCKEKREKSKNNPFSPFTFFPKVL